MKQRDLLLSLLFTFIITWHYAYGSVFHQQQKDAGELPMKGRKIRQDCIGITPQIKWYETMVVCPKWPCHCYQSHLWCQWDGLCKIESVFYWQQWQKDAGESPMKGRKIRQGRHGKSPPYLMVWNDACAPQMAMSLLPDSTVPSRHYVDRLGCHIYDWPAQWCYTYLGYTSRVTHQMGIFQMTILVNLQGTLHGSMYKSSTTAGHSLLTHRISPTILFGGVNHLGLVTTEKHPAVKKILLHLKDLN